MLDESCAPACPRIAIYIYIHALHPSHARVHSSELISSLFFRNPNIELQMLSSAKTDHNIRNKSFTQQFCLLVCLTRMLRYMPICNVPYTRLTCSCGCDVSNFVWLRKCIRQCFTFPGLLSSAERSVGPYVAAYALHKTVFCHPRLQTKLGQNSQI